MKILKFIIIKLIFIIIFISVGIFLFSQSNVSIKSIGNFYYDEYNKDTLIIEELPEIISNYNVNNNVNNLEIIYIFDQMCGSCHQSIYNIFNSYKEHSSKYININFIAIKYIGKNPNNFICVINNDVTGISKHYRFIRSNIKFLHVPFPRVNYLPDINDEIFNIVPNIEKIKEINRYYIFYTSLNEDVLQKINNNIEKFYNKNVDYIFNFSTTGNYYKNYKFKFPDDIEKYQENSNILNYNFNSGFAVLWRSKNINRLSYGFGSEFELQVVCIKSDSIFYKIQMSDIDNENLTKLYELTNFSENNKLISLLVPFFIKYNINLSQRIKFHTDLNFGLRYIISKENSTSAILSQYGFYNTYGKIFNSERLGFDLNRSVNFENDKNFNNISYFFGLNANFVLNFFPNVKPFIGASFRYCDIPYKSNADYMNSDFSTIVSPLKVQGFHRFNNFGLNVGFIF